MTLNFIPGHRDVKMHRHRNLCQSRAKFSMNFDSVLYAVETCWSEEPHIHFVLSIFKAENPAEVIWGGEPFNIGLHLGIYRMISFILGMMIETTELYSLIQL